jgi:hypothetical protein
MFKKVPLAIMLKKITDTDIIKQLVKEYLSFFELITYCSNLHAVLN